MNAVSPTDLSEYGCEFTAKRQAERFDIPVEPLIVREADLDHEAEQAGMLLYYSTILVNTLPGTTQASVGEPRLFGLTVRATL